MCGRSVSQEKIQTVNVNHVLLNFKVLPQKTTAYTNEYSRMRLHSEHDHAVFRMTEKYAENAV